ncbi:MAG TPA: VIT1/CCC1 transporter family protein [Chitinophagaceae bacterium]|nr:VIT1/CCC1 transporter family protein [Chitinophagaceae bacterium]HNF72041.1 VIT1/CCC1 transporter family protein [Chitinophagaceae bacterium]
MIRIQNIQTEVDAAFLYQVLADHEEDPRIASIFQQMSAIEKEHATAFMKSNGMNPDHFPHPSFRARMLSKLARVFGYDFLLGILLDTEKSLSHSIQKARLKTHTTPSLSDTAHVSILQNLLRQSGSRGGDEFARFEKKHRSVGGNALRAAVLGGNDGLVSNFSLVMGIAGASSGQKEVLLTGLAGLLAGALSMALGEWISVRSSQELYENQMELEWDELVHNPEGEQKELALIYESKGIPEEEARRLAAEAMLDKEKAHGLLVKEELGIQPEELKGSAMEAAFTSFFLFAIGAIIPVIPFFFTGGNTAIVVSAMGSAAGLFLIGSAITLFTGKSILYSGFRQVLFGLLAAAITFGIGRLIGVSIG